jgi:hypothetical protein
MAGTQLPDGSVVMQPSGQRPYPVGGGTAISHPAVAKGAGRGRSGLTAVNGSSRQPGRAAATSNAYK